MALEREAPGSVGAAGPEAASGRDADSTTGHERRRFLLTRARTEGRVGVTGAAQELQVSVETVRRDLKLLEDHGLVRREYGVAYPVESAGFETDLASREDWNRSILVCDRALRVIDLSGAAPVLVGFYADLVLSHDFPS